MPSSEISHLCYLHLHFAKKLTPSHDEQTHSKQHHPCVFEMLFPWQIHVITVFRGDLFRSVDLCLDVYWCSECKQACAHTSHLTKAKKYLTRSPLCHMNVVFLLFPRLVPFCNDRNVSTWPIPSPSQLFPWWAALDVVPATFHAYVSFCSPWPWASHQTLSRLVYRVPPSPAYGQDTT